MDCRNAAGPRQVFAAGVLLAGLLVAARSAAVGSVEAVRRDTAWLAGYASRAPGTEGHAEAQERLLAEVQAVPGVRVWTQEFPVVAPVVKRCELVIADGPLAGRQRVYPIWPDLVRLKTTPADGLSGDLTYVGTAALESLPARSLRGCIAVMEMSHYENWKQPFSMGATAVLLLGGPHDRALPPAQQALYMPRYYVPAGPLADALRASQIPRGTLFCEAGWQTVSGRNICALVKPRAGAETLRPVAVTAPYDATSVVMGLAPGADHAVDAALLLDLLRSTAAAPPPRAILFCFVDAYGMNQLGVRQLLTLLAVTPDDKTRKDYRKLDEKRLEDYEEIAGLVDELGEGPEALEQLWNKKKYRDIQRYFKDAIGPEILALKEDAGDLRLELHKTKDDAQRKKTREALERNLARMTMLNRTLSLALTKELFNDKFRPQGLAVWEGIRKRVKEQNRVLERQMSYFEDLDATRNEMLAAIGESAQSPCPVYFMLGLDLSDAGVALGPGLTCRHLWSNETAPAQDFTRWLKQLVKNREDPFWAGDAPALERTLNLDAIAGLAEANSFNVGNVGLITAPAASFQLNGATWLTLDGLRSRLDTPQDSFERLDWDRLGPQIRTTDRLLKRLFEDPAFVPEEKRAGNVRPRWRHGRGSVVAESVAETVPRTPMVGFLATLVGGSNNGPGPEGAAGIRRNEFVYTGPDGRFRFPPLPGQAHWQVTRMRVQAFKLADDGRIVAALSDSASMIAGRISATVNIRESPSASPARVVAFECRELNGPEFFDPRFLEPLSQFSLIDVTRGGTPKRYHFSIHRGQMFGLLAPKTPWQLLLRAGTAANRMVLMNVNTNLLSTGMSLREAIRTGYGPSDSLASIPSHVSARDLYTVDRWRAERFERAGISSKAIDTLRAQAENALTAADAALAADDGAALQRAAAVALGNEIRAYEALRQTGDDVTRGAIFLMILLVPFAVAMERLLFARPKIGQRITLAVTIFVLMTLVLWSFHPAFRITAQPIVIIMAFSILLLSLMVIVMILKKFESDLDELRSGRAEASGAQTSRGGVIGSAVWLGIANMRKRKLRTALTGTTIVLITFALLCFSSSTYYQDKRQFSLDRAEAPYPGVLIRQPRMRAMLDRSVRTVENLLEGKRRPAERYWWASATLPTWRLHVRNPLTGKQVPLKAALGLSPGESELTAPDRFMPNWERFSRGGACYVSARVAETLGVSPGDSILVGGEPLELAGVFDAGAVEQGLTMLDGQSLLPFDYSIEKEEVRTQESLEAELAAGVGLEPEVDAAYVSGDEVVIIPAAYARRAGAQLRSMAVRAESGAAAEETALSLMKVLAFPMYYGEGRDVKVVVSTPLIPKPPRNLLIPLLIAALIIFNTMLNSVAERKGEIHIYTSLGLAPQHVGMLFLAEALTYGLMGSIFGYVVGQGLATILTHLGLMGGVTLNYSGTNVIMTMSLVLLVVVLSAIVPAVMAGKLATPSKEMRWHVPEPQDGRIRDLLPFTVARGAAGGLAAFIYEYMDAHREGTIGQFTADNLEVLGPGEDRVSGVRGTVWLAPYDLGVRQDFLIEVHTEVEDICGIRIELTYGSGQHKTWWRLNHMFLGDVRRQLLGWRNIKTDRLLEYIARAKAVV